MVPDHGAAVPYPTESDPPPLFLSIRPGQFVVVSETPNVVMSDKTTWSVAEVIWCELGARNSDHTTMFQVMDVDSGVVKWINADAVTHLFHIQRSWRLMANLSTDVAHQ